MTEIRPIPRTDLFGKPQDTYYVLGLTGILLAVILLTPLCLWTNYRLSDVFFLFGIGLGASYVFNVIRAFLNVREAYSWYHYYILIATAAAVSGLLSGKNLLILGDLFALGMSFVCCIGRLGCFHAGCCYGKPSKRTPGIFPAQLAESALCFGCFAAGTLLIAAEAAFGIVFVVLTALYAFGRFLLEFRRGDERKYFLSVSEAQWTGMVITAFLLFVPTDADKLLFPAVMAILVIETTSMASSVWRHFAEKPAIKPPVNL